MKELDFDQELRFQKSSVTLTCHPTKKSKETIKKINRAIERVDIKKVIKQYIN